MLPFEEQINRAFLSLGRIPFATERLDQKKIVSDILV
jgi:hypothetical protein